MDESSKQMNWGIVLQAQADIAIIIMSTLAYVALWLFEPQILLLM